MNHIFQVKTRDGGEILGRFVGETQITGLIRIEVGKLEMGIKQGFLDRLVVRRWLTKR